MPIGFVVWFVVGPGRSREGPGSPRNPEGWPWVAFRGHPGPLGPGPKNIKTHNLCRALLSGLARDFELFDVFVCLLCQHPESEFEIRHVGKLAWLVCGRDLILIFAGVWAGGSPPAWSGGRELTRIRWGVGRRHPPRGRASFYIHAYIYTLWGLAFSKNNIGLRDPVSQATPHSLTS